MPRSRRTDRENIVLHVVNRGNDRRRLFADDRDYEAFMGLAAWAQAKASIPILAYVVMPNHWHFVVWPTSPATVSQFMRSLTGSHAALLRTETRTSGAGHVYQGRYHAFVVESSVRYYRTLRYVEANPVRAGLVVRAEHWKWSSLCERLGQPRLISDGPLPLPPLEEWLGFVGAPLTPDQTTAIKPRRPRRGIDVLWNAERAEPVEVQNLHPRDM
jgi:putative transposase